MALDISAETPRVQYTVTSADSTFDYDFEIFQDSDIKVFVDSTLKTLTTHYTVSGAGTTGGGTVTMTSGNAVTNATVTLVRDITIQRTTDFPASGSFQVDSLNTELDRITAVQQTLEDNIARSLRLADEDATSTLTLPLKDARKGRYLAFNATTGNAEAGPTQTDATLIATVTTDIALLADIQDGTTATNTLTTLSPISGNITTVAGVASNVTTIATGTTGGNSNLTNLNTIATGTTGGNANLTQINAVAGKVTEIGRLGTADAVADMALLGLTDVIADMALLGETAVIADMAQLANSDIIADMAQLANQTIIDDMALLANNTITDDMALLAVQNVIDDMALLAVPAVITDMDLIGASGVIANIATVAGKDTEIGQLAPKATDITTVAGKISDVEAVAHLEDGTTATSAVSTLSARSSDIQTLTPRASDMQSLATKATEIGRIGASTGNITNLNTLGTTDAVADMNTLASISSDISALAGALEQTYTTTVAGGVFVLGGSNNPAIEMFRGSSYTFNQDDATNDGHPLVFKNGSSAYEVGVTYYLNGSATTQANYINTTTFNAGRSSGTRKVVIEVQSTAPSSGLRYYCYIHGNGMGNTITVKDSNISLVATNIANVNNVGNNITALTNVNTNLAHVTNVHNNMSDVNAINGSGVISNIGTLATGTTGGNANLTQINAVAVAVANVNTVATNISSVNDFADKYRIGSSDPSSSNDEGDLFYNTSSNVLKVYTGSAWEAGVTAGSGFASLTGATFTGNVSFPDNVVARFGASNDLQISHNGNNSVIKDAGTGNLSLQTNGTNINLWDVSNAQLMGQFDTGGGVNLHHNGTKKFNTTSTGIDVTGNAKADSFTIDHASNDWNFELSGADLVIKNGSTTLFKLDTSGNLTVAGDITTDGSL